MNKTTLLLFIYVHLQAACVLDQFIQGSTHPSHWSHFFLYNIMIKVNQHALINLVFSYMVTKVFNPFFFISVICVTFSGLRSSLLL